MQGGALGHLSRNKTSFPIIKVSTAVSRTARAASILQGAGCGCATDCSDTDCFRSPDCNAVQGYSRSANKICLPCHCLQLLSARETRHSGPRQPGRSTCHRKRDKNLMCWQEIKARSLLRLIKFDIICLCMKRACKAEKLHCPQPSSAALCDVT